MNGSPCSLPAGILAAGRGERLRRKDGELKPLVKVSGRPLIEHVLSSMAEANASEVVVIINEDSTAVRDHVSKMSWPFEVRWLVESPPSSMHSFLRLMETLAATGGEGPFLLSTVDTVARCDVFARLIEHAREHSAAVTLALTSPGDDEKPLLVRTASPSDRIVAFGEGDYATAGVYAVRPVILREAEDARREGIDALRKFLGRLLERGYELHGVPISGSIDVDRPADIELAEVFLREQRP
jgi:NDP-sugar pyrophosphorylase family protein